MSAQPLEKGSDGYNQHFGKCCIDQINKKFVDDDYLELPLGRAV